MSGIPFRPPLGAAGIAAALTVGLIAFAAKGPPRPLPATAAASVFSADRAMRHVRALSERPHPPGSADHVRVRDHDVIVLFTDLEEAGLLGAPRGFAVAPIGAPNRVWVGDLTVPHDAGRLALPRRGPRPRLPSGDPLGDAAHAGGGADPRCAHHGHPEPAARRRRVAPLRSRESARIQVRAYRALVRAHGGVLSMSRRGNCYDNAVGERFFATLKIELGDGFDWDDERAARRDLFDLIEVWYNRQRRHSTLGYLSPVAYEESLVRQACAA